LSNFFSGLYLMVDRPVNPGDYIKLDTDHEGYVVRIGWRSTILRTLNNNYVVLPNVILAKAVIINYSMPAPQIVFSLEVHVAYGTDPERVEKTLLRVAQEAIQDGLSGLLANPAPSVTFIPGFGDSSLGFTLSMNLGRFDDQYSVQTELRKRVVKRFKEEGIEMPFPTRTLRLDQQTVDLVHGEKA
jgi:small-conductance mechanosensitive channel